MKKISLILLVAFFSLCCVNNAQAVLFQDDFESNTTVSTAAWPDSSGDYDPDAPAAGTWTIDEDWDEGVQVSSYTGGGQPTSAHSGDNYLIAGYHGDYDNTFQHSGLATANLTSSVGQAVVDFWTWGFSGQYGIVQGRDLHGVNDKVFELLFWDGFEVKYDGVELAARLTQDAWNHIVVDLDLVNDTAGVTINNQATEFLTAGNLTDVIDTLLFRDEYTGYYDDISVNEPNAMEPNAVEPVLVSYYPFDGTLEDTAGSYDGTIMPSGGPSYIAGPYSLGQALLLDGGQYVDIGYGQPRDEVIRNGSVSLWFNVSAEPVQYKMLFGTANDGITSAIWAGVDTSNLIEVGIRNDLGENITWTYDNSQSVSSDTWYFYTATWGINSQTGNLDINEYLNSVLIRRGTQTDPGAISWQYPMVLGAGNSRGSVEDFFVGAIDDIKFYDYPLSAARIQQEYVDVTGSIIHPVTIMPLGDSITYGAKGSADDTGYRRFLYLALESAGLTVDFVGTVTSGVPNDFDRNHEGHGGWTASQIRDNIYNWLVTNPADIVLLHIGTNDIEHDEQDVQKVEDILNEINRYEVDFSSNVTVLVARIILRDDTKNPQTIAFNDAVEGMVNTRVTAGDDLVMVDMENALVYPDDLFDRLHPNESGYTKMADTWFAPLAPLVSNKLNEPLCLDRPVTDFTGDCKVGLDDMAILAGEWLLDGNLYSSE